MTDASDRVFAFDDVQVDFDDDADPVPIQDVELSVDSDIEPIDDARQVADGDREIEFSLTIPLELEQTVVCHGCGALNDVVDASVLTFFEADPRCHRCRRPLGLVR